jgi:hypothetical protein
MAKWETAKWTALLLATRVQADTVFTRKVSTVEVDVVLGMQIAA